MLAKPTTIALVLIEVTVLVASTCCQPPPRVTTLEAQRPSHGSLRNVIVGSNAGSNGTSVELGDAGDTERPEPHSNLDPARGLAVAEHEYPVPAIVVITEPVELEGQRSRPSGAVAAAVADEQMQIWNVGGSSDPHHVSNQEGFHPGTRVRVDTHLRLKRSKNAAEISNRVQAGLRSRGYWPFRNCYEEVAREYADPGGTTWLRISIGAKGSVISARLLRTDVKHKKIAQCHARAARGLRIETPRARRVDVDVTVAVWPGDVPLLPLPIAEGRKKTLDWGRMTHAVSTIDADVAGCLRDARMRDPKLWGRLALSFALDSGGHASSIREFESQFGDGRAIACVTNRLQGPSFPESESSDARFVASWRMQPAVSGVGTNSLGSAPEAVGERNPIAAPERAVGAE